MVFGVRLAAGEVSFAEWSLVMSVDGTSFGSVDTLAVVDGTDVWFIIWATILMSIAIGFQYIALEVFFDEAQTSFAVKNFEGTALFLFKNTLACEGISLALACFFVIIFSMNIGAG